MSLKRIMGTSFSEGTNIYLAIDSDNSIKLVQDTLNSDGEITDTTVMDPVNRTLASATTDGLMTKEDKVYLENLIKSLTSANGTTSISNGDSELIVDTNGSVTMNSKNGQLVGNYLINYLVSNKPELVRSLIEASYQDSVHDDYKESSEVDQTDKDFTITTKLTGGNNLVLNSTFSQGTDNWVISQGIANEEIIDPLDNTSSRSCITSVYKDRLTLLQEVTVKPNTTYGISEYLKIDKADSNFSWSGIEIYSDNNLLFKLGNSTVTGWTRQTGSFTTDNTTTVRIQVTSDLNSLSSISSIMINEGKLIDEWQPNKSDLSDLSLKLDKTGLGVGTSDGKGVKLTRKDIKILFKDDALSDITIGQSSLLNRLTVLSELLLGNIRVVPVQGKNANGLAFVKG